MKVVIIGAGNVATVLGKKIVQSGNEIVQVIARNEMAAAELASFFNCSFTGNLLNITRSADIYIIAISDSSIQNIAFQLQLNNKVVVHTAASISAEVLSKCSINYGVLYPLQTLRKEIQALPVIPILLQANNNETAEVLSNFTRMWTDNVTFTGDNERLKLHLAAVFTNNFVTHLLAISERICVDNGLEFNLLRSIFEETIKRVTEFSPSMVQTGPAVRNDEVTISKHQGLLADQPEFLNVYNALTSSIIHFYKPNNG